MKLTNEFSDIREWASAKGIYQNGDIKTQYIKLQEECGELAKAIINNDIEEIIDAIGDCVIVLTSIAKFSNNINMPKNNFTGSQLENNITIEQCINSAYNVIKKRNGKMLNGSFIKDNGGNPTL